jgi:2-polyprenyl-6-methoxyphenol hydroxylase-like FAD-dependent oxidoreductase
MMARADRTALIVGAGIGGLAAARALSLAGWRVRVFERAQNPRELGFALLLAPNAMRALDALGLAAAVAADGVVARLGEIRRADGRVLRRLDASALSAALGAPTVCVLRPVLHGLLLDVVAGDGPEPNSEAADFADNGDGVTLHFTDGRTASGDVLVGADGVRSTIRRLLHPSEPPPRASGLFALRGVAFDVAHHLGELSGAQYFGRGLEAGVGRASQRAVYWYVSMPAAEATQHAGEPRRLAQRLSGRFHEPFRAIVAATKNEDLRLDELVEREPLDRWGRGAATLLGDAAHPMLPHAGQGAAQALEDAVALARALTDHAVPADALRFYERTRGPRTRTIVALARRNARVGSVRNAFGCWLRDLTVKLVPESVVARSLIAVARIPEESQMSGAGDR